MKLNVVYDDLYLIFIVCCVIQKKITVSYVAWKTFWNKYAGSKNVMSHQHEIMLGIHRKGYSLLGKRHNTVSEKQSQFCFVCFLVFWKSLEPYFFSSFITHRSLNYKSEINSLVELFWEENLDLQLAHTAIDCNVLSLLNEDVKITDTLWAAISRILYGVQYPQQCDF